MKVFSVLTLISFLTISFHSTAQLSETNASSKGEIHKTEGINYQAIARDVNGQILKNHRIGIRIEILAGATDENIDFRELHHVTTNDLGHFNLVIGHGKKEIGSFESVQWEKGNKWLKISLDLEEKKAFLNLQARANF